MYLINEASCIQIRPSCQGSRRLGWTYTEPNCVGRISKDRISPRRNFRGPNSNGSNCSEANCQEPSCPGPNIAEHLHKAELSRPTRQNQAFRILNTEKNIGRKAVHVVILGVTIAYM